MRGTPLGRRAVIRFAIALEMATTAPVVARADPSPTDPIHALNDTLLKIMHDGRQVPFAKRFQTLAPTLERTFDLSTILQESVGSSWSTFPQDQQTIVMDAFRRYTIASYVNSFDNYSGQRFDIDQSPRSLSNGDEIVETRITSPSGEQHSLNYVMRRSDGGWRVVDVLADGSISRVAVQRSDFRRLLARGGPPALADSLRNKSADLSGGSA